MPLFLLVIVGMVGLADLLIAEQKMDEASARAARVAALGGSDQQIKEAVRAVLGPDRVENARICVTPVPPSANSPAAGSGDPPVGQLELIEVRVELAVRDAAATRFVPLRGNELVIGRTVVHRQ